MAVYKKAFTELTDCQSDTRTRYTKFESVWGARIHEILSSLSTVVENKGYTVGNTETFRQGPANCIKWRILRKHLIENNGGVKNR